MLGEVEQGGGIDIVEVIEDAGLVGAEDGRRLFVADVAAVAGEIDLRVTVEDGIDAGEHSASIGNLICFVKQNDLPRGSLAPGGDCDYVLAAGQEKDGRGLR